DGEPAQRIPRGRRPRSTSNFERSKGTFSSMTRSFGESLFKIAVAITLFSLVGSSPAALAQSGFQVTKSLYSERADSAKDIDAAERAARHDHRRVLLDFGGYWCGDCQVLDFY